jgi:hypothetical protein
MYNLFNSCGSVSPAINEGKEVGLLHHDIKNAIQTIIQKEKICL